MITEPITVVENIPLTCKRIENKVIVNVYGSWIPIYQNMIIGYYRVGNNPFFESNDIYLMYGEGQVNVFGYVEIVNTVIRLKLPVDWTDGSYAHIRGVFSFYV